MAHQRRQSKDEKARRSTGPRVEPWQFEAVREAGLAVASELSIDKVLQKLVDLARDLVDARYAALGVAREDLRGLRRFIVSGITETEIRRIPHWPVGLGLLGVLLREPKPLRVKNISEDTRSIGFPHGHPGMVSFLGVPIVSKGRILGNFYLTEKVGADEFSESDESLIVLFAAHAAVAIENARLYTETNDKLKEKVLEVERAEQRSRFLADLSSILLGKPEVEELPLEEMAARASEILGDASAIYVLDPNDPKTLRRQALYHSDPQRAQAAREFLEQSWETIADAVMDKQNSLFVADVNAKPQPATSLDLSLLKAKRFTAAMILPLKTARKLYGVFVSLASFPLTLSDEDLAFGSLVGERLAVALESAFLIEELTAALKLRDEFISIASHELKTPITALKGFAQAAARSKDNPELQQRALTTINRQADRLVNLVNELLDVARLQAGRLELHRERVNLIQLTTEVSQRFIVQLQAEDKHNLVTEAAQPEIWGEWDPTRIDQVLTNLISNAIKYSPAGGAVTVVLKALGDNALIAVSDPGLGIPREQQGRIFEPFFRARNVDGLPIEGTGLGLHITREIIMRHNGRIWFESEEGKGTTFYVELPLSPPA